jgi:hypothetical protein
VSPIVFCDDHYARTRIKQCDGPPRSFVDMNARVGRQPVGGVCAGTVERSLADDYSTRVEHQSLVVDGRFDLRAAQTVLTVRGLSLMRGGPAVIAPAVPGSARRRRGSRVPARISESTWAWYLPMWVSNERPLTIANRVQPKMTGHPKALIDPDRLARRQPNGLEAEVLGEGSTTGGDQDLLATATPPSSRSA